MAEEKRDGAPLLGWVTELQQAIAAMDSGFVRLKTFDLYLNEFRAIIGTFADKTGQGIVLIQDNKYIWANRAACQIFGYTLDEMLAIGPEQTTLPSLRDRYLARNKLLLAGDTFEEPGEWPVLRKDRTIKHISAFAYRVTFMLKPALLVFFYDTTEQKKIQAELALRAELLDLVTDAIVLMEPLGKIVYANSASCELSGYTREELLNMTALQLTPPEFAHRARTRGRQFSEHKESTYKGLMVRKDGTRVPVEVRGRVVTQGGKPFLLGVVRQIAPKKVHNDMAQPHDDKSDYQSA